ncbi:MAG: flagellar hook-length control protein FliK, partial [Pseudomonadales bacterium]
LAAAPMQLRIIGSALRVVTPARNLELEAQGEAIASSSPEASGAPVLPQSQARGADAQEAPNEEAALAIEAVVSTAAAPTVDTDRALKPDEIDYRDEVLVRPEAAGVAPVGVPLNPAEGQGATPAMPALDSVASMKGVAAAPAAPAAQTAQPAQTAQTAPAAPAAQTAQTIPVLPEGSVEIVSDSQRGEAVPVGPANRVAVSAKGAPAPRAPLAGAELRDAKAPLNTDRGAPVAVGAVALGLREALKGEGRSARELQGQRVEAASRPQRPAVQAASGWALKQNLGAQARGFDRPAAQRTATIPSASAGAEGAPLAEGVSSPLLAGADRRELDLVALARPMPGVEGEGAELSEKFATQLAQRVVAQAAAGQLTSRIALNPAQLGPLEVRLELSGDRIAVEFQAHHAMTRELLGDGLGRLKEGLEQAGFEVTRLSTEGRGAGGSGLGGQQGGAFAQSGQAGGQASQGNGNPGALGAGRSEEGSMSSQESAGKGQGSPGNDAGLDITV